MSALQRKLLWPVIVAVAIVFTGLSWSSTWTGASGPAEHLRIGSAIVPLRPQTSPTSPRTNALRSRLSRQPEVSKVRDFIGQRLRGKKPATSVLVGVLTTGTTEQSVRILRHQGEEGEGVEVSLGDRRTPLTWNAAEGTRSAGDTPADNERLIVERLTLDSPDQFVLAQLRGASYYTVGRNVRPEQAGGSDGYSGPLWNVVRVGEAGGARTQNRWRLYYLNTATGLIDRIVSSEQGEAVVAELSGWTVVNGEKMPARITWTRQGQVVMQFRLTNFSYGTE